MEGHGFPVSRQQFETLTATRQNLLTAALAAVRALYDFDAQVLAPCLVSDQPRSTAGLAAAVRRCAPLVEQRGDWAALYMLCRERNVSVTYAELIRVIAEAAPQSPQPKRQHIQSAEWDTERKRFPNWEPKGIRYDKFRRHYLIAQAAADCLA